MSSPTLTSAKALFKMRTGRPAVCADWSTVPLLSRQDLQRVISKYLWLPKGEVIEIVKYKSDDIPMIEALVCSVLMHAYKSGDTKRFHWILQRSGVELPSPDEVAVEDDDARKAEVIMQLDESNVITLLSSHS